MVAQVVHTETYVYQKYILCTIFLYIDISRTNIKNIKQKIVVFIFFVVYLIQKILLIRTQNFSKLRKLLFINLKTRITIYNI